MSRETVVIPVLSHMIRDKEIFLRALRCLSVKTPCFCHQNLPDNQEVWVKVWEESPHTSTCCVLGILHTLFQFSQNSCKVGVTILEMKKQVQLPSIKYIVI